MTSISAQDPDLLLESLIRFGRSPDGAVERDLRSAIARLRAERAEAQAEAVRLRSYNEGLGKIAAELEAERDDLLRANALLHSLLTTARGECDALRSVVRKIAGQLKSDELGDEDGDDFEGAYDAMIEEARDAVEQGATEP